VELGGKARDGVNTAATKAQHGLKDVYENGIDLPAAVSPRKWAIFFSGCGAGIVLLMLSLQFLPVIVLFPAKFALFFTLGSATIVGSVTYLRGPKRIAEAVVERSRLPFTIGYALSFVGTLWSAVVMKAYIYTLVFSGLQAVSFSYFLCSFMPGGTRVLEIFVKFHVKIFGFCGRAVAKAFG